MDYRYFKSKNDANKHRNKNMYSNLGRFEKLSSQEDTCSLSLRPGFFKIKDVIKLVLNSDCFISNPSALTDYNFNKLNSTSNLVRLYHGSDGGLKGSVRHDKSAARCDFGKGFYTGTLREQACNRVCNCGQAFVYDIDVDLSSLKVYEFNDPILWALFIAYNRGSIDFSKYPKLVRIFNVINSNDVIIGVIADDTIAQVYSEFLQGNITDKCLVECLRYVKYGNQVVFKNMTACRKVKIVNTQNLSKEDKKVALEWGRGLKLNLNENLDKLKIMYRRNGLYIDEVLGGYM